MGKAVEKYALSRGHRIIQRFHEADPVTASALECAPDVAIDFTQPQAAIPNIARYCEAGIPAVIGTTGWYDRLSDVHGLVRHHKATIFYSSNYSMGIQLLLEALHGLVPLLDKLPEFDVSVHEFHHLAKLDSPSGTAISLANVLVENMQRKHTWSELSASDRDPNQLSVVATRLGHVFGKHQIVIDGPADHIVLEHTAGSRAGFALGAVRAAEWIQGRTGCFTMKDMLSEWLAGHSKLQPRTMEEES